MTLPFSVGQIVSYLQVQILYVLVHRKVPICEIVIKTFVLFFFDLLPKICMNPVLLGPVIWVVCL